MADTCKRVVDWCFDRLMNGVSRWIHGKDWEEVDEAHCPCGDEAVSLAPSRCSKHIDVARETPWYNFGNGDGWRPMRMNYKTGEWEFNE